MLEEALLKSASLLQSAKGRGLCKDFAVIGGLAVSARGVPRATQDIDFIIDIEDAQCQELAKFIEGEYRPPDLGDPLAGVFLFSSPSELRDVRVQAVRFGPKLTVAALGDVSTIDIEGASIPVVGLEGLILLKLFAGGPQDLLDVATLISASQLSELQMKSLRTLLEGFGLRQKLETVLKSQAD